MVCHCLARSLGRGEQIEQDRFLRISLSLVEDSWQEGNSLSGSREIQGERWSHSLKHWAGSQEFGIQVPSFL